MKKLLIILVLLPVISFSQVQDSSEIRLMQAFNHVAFCLEYSHNQYTKGLWYTVGGVAAMTTGVILQPSINNQSGVNIIYGVGGLFALIGTVIIIDSHKWIGRAGRVRLDANKIVIDF